MFNEIPKIEEVIEAFKTIENCPTIYCGCGSNIRTRCAYECQIIEKYFEERRSRIMLVTGRIEVFKNSNGYPVGILKSFTQDGILTARMFVNVELRDEKLNEKLVEGKTLTINVTQGYLNVQHVELENESFNRVSIGISKGELVSVFPAEEKKPAKKTTKKSTK